MTDGMRDEWDPEEVADAETFNGLIETFAMGPDGELVFRDVDGVTGSVGVFDADGQWCGEAEAREIDIPDVPERRRVSEPVPVAASATDDDDAPGNDAGASVGRVRVVPEWMTDRSAVGAMAGYVGSQVAFHVVRSPWWALRGLGACVVGLGRWALLVEDRDTYRAAMDGASMEKRHEMRAHRLRGQVGRSVVAVSPALGVWAWVEHGQWGLLPVSVIAAAYVGAAVVGWRAGRTARTPRERAALAVSRGRRPDALTESFLMGALDRIGCGAKGDDRPVLLGADRVTGGQLVRVQLAPGLTMADLVGKQRNLASALGRPAECVVIDAPRHAPEGCVEIFLADKTMGQRGAPKWPLRAGRKRSFFDPVPVGVDQRGQTVAVPMAEVHRLISGATGMGKTFTARLLLLAAALDPRVILLIYNLKGGRDYTDFGPVAHTLRSGSSPADVDALVRDLEWIQGEIGRRGRILETLDGSDVPDGKLTDGLADRAGLAPIVLMLDEAQRAYAHPRVRDKVHALVEDIVRTGRAVGVHVQQVSQGTKEGAIPSQIVDQHSERIGHGVTNTADANQALGSDAHARGFRAVDIQDAGVAYVGSAGGTMVRTAIAYVDLPGVAKIVGKARKLREDAGTLSGMAAGHVAPDSHDGGVSEFLGDVLRVWPVDDAGQRWRNVLSATLADRLTLLDEYEGVTGPDVTRRMRDAGVHVGSQRTHVGGGQGVKLVDVERAAGE